MGEILSDKMVEFTNNLLHRWMSLHHEELHPFCELITISWRKIQPEPSLNPTMSLDWSGLILLYNVMAFVHVSTFVDGTLGNVYVIQNSKPSVTECPCKEQVVRCVPYENNFWCLLSWINIFTSSTLDGLHQRQHRVNLLLVSSSWFMTYC